MISQLLNWKESRIQAQDIQLPTGVQEKGMPETSLCAQRPTVHKDVMLRAAASGLSALRAREADKQAQRFFSLART